MPHILGDDPNTDAAFVNSLTPSSVAKARQAKAEKEREVLARVDVARRAQQDADAIAAAEVRAAAEAAPDEPPHPNALLLALLEDKQAESDVAIARLLSFREDPPDNLVITGA